MSVTLKNTSPLGDIQIPMLRLEVKAGDTFTVPDEVAGKEPTFNKDGEITDPGEGLLAQVGNYERVGPKPAKKAAAKRASKKAAAKDPEPPVVVEPVSDPPTELDEKKD